MSFVKKKKIMHVGVKLLSLDIGAWTQPIGPRHMVSFYKFLYFFKIFFYLNTL